MSLSKDQINKLLSLVATTTDDDMSCDACLVNVAQFAEAELIGSELDESLLKVKNHLQNCPCCSDEYQALLAALQAV